MRIITKPNAAQQRRSDTRFFCEIPFRTDFFWEGKGRTQAHTHKCTLSPSLSPFLSFSLSLSRSLSLSHTHTHSMPERSTEESHCHTRNSRLLWNQRVQIRVRFCRLVSALAQLWATHAYTHRQAHTHIHTNTFELAHGRAWEKKMHVRVSVCVSVCVSVSVSLCVSVGFIYIIFAAGVSPMCSWQQ